MTTSVWTESYTGPASQQQQAPLEPRRSAPPVMQQATASTSAQSQPQEDDDVIWDDSMMDVEDERALSSVAAVPIEAASQPPAEMIQPSNVGLLARLVLALISS